MRLFEKILFILLVVSVAFTLSTLDADSMHTPVEPLQEITQGWYRLEEGVKVPVTVPGTVSITQEAPLVLYNESLPQEAAGKTISTRGAVYRLQIALENQVLYTYEDAAFPRNEQMRAKLDCVAVLPGDVTDKPLMLIYENPGNGVFKVESVYLGMSSEIFRYQAMRDIVNLLCAFVMVILSVITMGISMYLSRIHMLDKRFRDISAFLLLCATWCTMDAALIQQMSALSPVPCYLAFYALMTLGIPMLHFVEHTGKMRRFRSIRVWTYLFYLNVIGQSLLHMIGGIPMIDMLFATHLLLGSGCGWLAVLMLREYAATKRKDLLITLLGFGLLAVCGVLALVLYWALEIPNYELIFELGIILLIVCLLSLLVVTMGENLRFRIEATVYKRLSQQDRLTGLANRRSFDDFLVSLERDADKYQNIALIFLDLNYLKDTNDRFGHNAGDELIISASRCIEHTFSPLGSCYRIGGDEFAVIITNPTDDETVWNNMIDEAIARQNRTGKYRLSIARGSSLLRDVDGQIKRLSDWKFEADQAMYQCKSAQKKAAREKTEATGVMPTEGGERHA